MGLETTQNPFLPQAKTRGQIGFLDLLIYHKTSSRLNIGADMFLRNAGSKCCKEILQNLLTPIPCWLYTEAADS